MFGNFGYTNEKQLATCMMQTRYKRDERSSNI